MKTKDNNARSDNTDKVPEFPALVTPSDAALLLLINERSVTRLLTEGKLPGFKVGDQWRLRRADLLALVTSTFSRPDQHP
jgi:excisionase family DNA binding protein